MLNFLSHKIFTNKRDLEVRDEKNEDSAVRQIKRFNRATKEQCVRLIQMAGLTMGICMQLKGCVQATVDKFDDNDSNGSINDGPNEVQMVLWILADNFRGNYFVSDICLSRDWP